MRPGVRFTALLWNNLLDGERACYQKINLSVNALHGVVDGLTLLDPNPILLALAVNVVKGVCKESYSVSVLTSKSRLLTGSLC